MRGFRLQAAQDDLLQPGRRFGRTQPRRSRIHPQALAQSAAGLRIAERQLAGGQFVEHDADREHVAARVAAHAHHLFRRDPWRRAHRQSQFLRQQIRVMRVPAEPEIDQHRAAVGSDHHIAGLEVQVHCILLVQAVRRHRHGGTEPRDLGGRRTVPLPVGTVEPILQRLTLYEFHHQIGQPRQIPRRDEARHVGAGEHLQHLVLDFETDDGFRAVAPSHARYLHDQRKTGIAAADWRTARDRCAPCCRRGCIRRSGSRRSRCRVAAASRLRSHSPCASRCALDSGRPASRIACAAAW